MFAALSVLALALSGCGSPDGSGDPEPRPLTLDEATVLAMTRFENFDAGVREVSFTVSESGAEYAVSGWVDFESHAGYAIIGSNGESSLLTWTTTGVGTHPLPDGASTPVLPPPGLAGDGAGWTSSELVPTGSRLHAALALPFSLASDRPDNPLLLQQSDARRLRTDEIGGVPLTVYAGPTADRVFDPESGAPGDGSAAVLRFWVDERGLLHRLEARLGGGDEWTVYEFGPAVDVDFVSAFEEGTAGTR